MHGGATDLSWQFLSLTNNLHGDLDLPAGSAPYGRLQSPGSAPLSCAAAPSPVLELEHVAWEDRQGKVSRAQTWPGILPQSLPKQEPCWRIASRTAAALTRQVGGLDTSRTMLGGEKNPIRILRG